jgi:hypothetical protein
MRKAFLTIATMIFIGITGHTANLLGGEVPFPWGKEIPFPWKQIEGNWNVERGAQQPQMHFNVLYEHEDGVRVVQVTMYDEQGQMYAKGSGALANSEKTLRAIMSTVSGDTFLLFVRAFADIKECLNGRIAVVVTERQMEQRKNSHDNHYIIYKPTDPSICSKMKNY